MTKYNYGDVPAPTREEWQDAFNSAPVCHHPAPPVPMVDKQLIDEIEGIFDGE